MEDLDVKIQIHLLVADVGEVPVAAVLKPDPPITLREFRATVLPKVLPPHIAQGHYVFMKSEYDPYPAVAEEDVTTDMVGSDVFIKQVEGVLVKLKSSTASIRAQGSVTGRSTTHSRVAPRISAIEVIHKITTSPSAEAGSLGSQKGRLIGTFHSNADERTKQMMEEANRLNFKKDVEVNVTPQESAEKPLRARLGKQGVSWKAPKLISTMTNRVDDESFVGDLERALNGHPEKNAYILVTDQEGNVIRCKNSAHLNDILASYKFDDFKKETEDEKSPAEQSTIWIDIEGENTAEITQIGKRFGLHPLTVEDCTSHQGRQKLEPFQEYMFLVLKSLHHSHYSWETENYIKICVFPSVVLTFHRYPSYAIQVARNRLVRVRQHL
jgi:hypothetical protein